MIRVAVVDDHILTLKGIEFVLSDAKNITIADTFTDGYALLNILKSQDIQIDLVILDLNMPTINGVEMCKTIKANHPEIKVIILSMIDDVRMVKRMSKYGADGYLLKNNIQDELNKAINEVMAGNLYFNKEIRMAMLKSANDSPQQYRNKALRPQLSRRETEVLKLIVQEYTTPLIAAELYISEGTVITHRKHLLTKTNAKNTAGLVRIAIEWGLV